ALVNRDGEWLGVHRGIVNRDLNLHVSEVAAMESLGHTHRFAMGMAESIQPASIIESRRVDDQRIAIPLADGVPQPTRLWIVAWLSPIDKYLAEAGVLLVEHGDHRRC